MLCYGNIGKPKEMTDACESCNLCMVDITSVFDEEKVQCTAPGEPTIKCKRDNPNFTPMTKKEFLSVWHKIPIYKRKYQGLLDAYLLAKHNGAIE